MTGPRYLSRWVGAASLLLAFAAFGLLCLWAGMVLGTAFVQTGASVVHGFLEIELITKFVPEALHRNPGDVLSVMSVMPLVVALLAAMHGGWSMRLARFATSVVRLLEESLKFPAGEHSWFGEPGKPGLLQSFLAPCPHLAVAAFLVGSYGTTPAETSRPVAYVLAPDSMLSVLRIHPLVHFENAEVGPAGELTERGVTLSTAREAALEEVVEALRPCAAPERPVTIRPYGFASDDPFLDRFSDGIRDDSDELNVEAANRRAEAVHAALAKLTESAAPDEPGMTVEAPIAWGGFDEMVEERNAMIRVPADSARDPFNDRVVVLLMMSTGACRAVDPPAPANPAEPTARTDTAPRLDTPPGP